MLLTTPARGASHPLNVIAPEIPLPDKVVLTEADLASRWGMSPKTLQRWRTEGRGPLAATPSTGCSTRTSQFGMHSGKSPG